MKAKRTGVYAIICTETQGFYIGSAVYIDRRWSKHRNDLRRNKHHCCALQLDWVRHGETAFRFAVIEECEREHLLEREQYYLDIWKPKYNTCRTAGSRLGTRNSPEAYARQAEKLRARADELHNEAWRAKARASWTPERREKLSERLRNTKRTPEWKQRISAAKKGNNGLKGRPVSQETREKITAAQRGKSRRGTPWTPERRARFIASMTGKKRPDVAERNRDPEFQKRARAARWLSA